MTMIENDAGNQISFTALVVDDLDKSSAFYGMVCGLQESARFEQDIAGRPVLELTFQSSSPGTGNFVLVKFLDAPKKSNQDVILGFVTDDVMAFVERAQRAGGKVLKEPYTDAEQGLRAAFVADSEGNILHAVEML
jgi:lactoylglutathione lyase